MNQREINIVFVGCHPDDEAIWCGGLLYELSRFPFVRMHVICVSGKDEASRREAEFLSAKEVARYASGVVLGMPLRGANDPLPDVGVSVESGLKQIDLEKNKIDLVVTHSPYGDEHLHPHHVQAHFSVKSWAKKNKIPFGFFSILPIPHLIHKNILLQTRRKGTFQFLSVAKCCPAPSPLFYLFNLGSWVVKTRPKYFLQVLTDLEVKKRMLNCYQSVDLKVFENGYAAFTNPCESLYLQDKNGMKPFLEVMKLMEVNGSPILFNGPVFLQKVARRLGKLFS